MTNTALQTALSYYRAWTAKDLDRAFEYVSDDIVCDGPAGRTEGIAGYREFLGPFVERMFIRAELIAAFGDDEVALIMYDTETVATPSAPAAECLTVRDGKIVHSRFLFDRTPFDEFRRRQIGE